MKKIWYIQSKSKIFGPYTISQMQVLLKRGKINTSSRVSLDQQHWLALDKSKLMAQIKAAKAKRRELDKKDRTNTSEKIVTANTHKEIVTTYKPEETPAVDTPKEILTVDVSDETPTIDAPEAILTADTPEEILTVDVSDEKLTIDAPEAILTTDEKLRQKLEARRKQHNKFSWQKLFNMAKILLILLLVVVIVKAMYYSAGHTSKPSGEKAYEPPKTIEERIKYLEEALLFVAPTDDHENFDKRCVITKADPKKVQVSTSGAKTIYRGQYNVQANIANIGTVDGFNAKPTAERCFEGTLDYEMTTQTVASKDTVSQLKATFNVKAYDDNIVYARSVTDNGEQELTYGESLLKGQVDLPAPNELSFKDYKKEREKLNKRAFKMITTAAEKGNEAAYTKLAKQYYAGIGTTSDIDSAIAWLEKVQKPDASHTRYVTELKTERGACLRAKQNPSNKARHKALMLKCVRLAGEQKHFSKVIASLTPIAEDGDSEAQYMLSQVYAKGNYDAQQDLENYTGNLFYGVESNYDTSYKWLEDAANNGNKQAQIEFAATAYANNNPKIAFNFFSQLANETSEFTPLAQSYLAKQYYDGYGVEKDSEKAIELMQQAAENDANDALETLQVWTQEALGEDLEKALEEKKKTDKKNKIKKAKKKKKTEKT